MHRRSYLKYNIINIYRALGLNKKQIVLHLGQSVNKSFLEFQIPIIFETFKSKIIYIPSNRVIFSRYIYIYRV